MLFLKSPKIYAAKHFSLIEMKQKNREFLENKTSTEVNYAVKIFNVLGKLANKYNTIIKESKIVKNNKLLVALIKKDIETLKNEIKSKFQNKYYYKYCPLTKKYN